METLDKIMEEMARYIIDEDIKPEDIFEYSYEALHGVIYTNKKINAFKMPLESK